MFFSLSLAHNFPIFDLVIFNTFFCGEDGKNISCELSKKHDHEMIGLVFFFSSRLSLAYTMLLIIKNAVILGIKIWDYETHWEMWKESWGHSLGSYN